jgi:GIY-YIG catalytic domain.
MANEWSTWYDVDFTDKASYNKSVKDLPKKPAVYAFRIVDNDRKPLPIQTANGFDEQGIIYVGQAKNLRKRYGSKYVAYDKGEKRCSSLRAIARKVKTNASFKNKYPDAKFQISYTIVANEEASKELEMELLHCYVQKYIYGPLLNSKLPYEYEDYNTKLLDELNP